MSYLTLEVEIDHGKVVVKDPAQLPPKASGLLTVFHPDAQPRPALTPLQALDALQRHLQLDAKQAAAWMNAVREARRLSARPTASERGSRSARPDAQRGNEKCVEASGSRRLRTTTGTRVYVAGREKDASYSLAGSLPASNLAY